MTQPTMRAKRSPLTVLLYALAALGGISAPSAFAACTANCPPPPSTWDQLHADETNASFNPNETSLSFARLQTSVQKARYAVTTPVAYLDYLVAPAGLVVAEFDGFYSPFSYGFAYVYDAVTGAMKWSPHISDPELITGATYHYPPFAVTFGTRLYATLRTADVPNGVTAGGIWGYNAQTGSMVGSGLGYLPGTGKDFLSVTYSRAAPTITTGALYYARQDGGFSAVSTTTGNLLWSLQPGANALYLNPVAVAANRIFIVRQQNPGQLQAQTNTLFCNNASTGAPLWQHTFPGQNVVSAPAYYNGSVYVKVRTTGFVGLGQVANNIVRLDAASGVELANAGANGITNLATYDQSPTVGNGVLIAQGTTGSVLAPNSILALDAVTLKKKWEVTLDGATDGLYDSDRAPSIANDFVAACSGGRMRVWQLSNGLGDQGFFTLANLSCRAQPVVAGGRLIFASLDFDYSVPSWYISAYGAP